MRYPLIIALNLFLMLFHSLSIKAQQQYPDYESRTRQLIAHMQVGDIDQQNQLFDAGMQQWLQSNSLQQFWNQIQSQGVYNELRRFHHEPLPSQHSLIAVLVFGQLELGMRLVFDAEKKISGLQFVQAPPASFTPPPPYADPALFSEKDLFVDCGDIQLPAKLTMPHAQQPVPLVVLVHGSGPNDMDETIGPNKPFRDIAWGLSSRGIAVLRYDKRTKNHATLADIEHITPWTETGQDAVHAINLATSLPGIDPSQIFVLGHSQGGMMAPQIAQASGGIAGIIIMGGNSGKLYDLIIEQFEHLGPLQDPEARQYPAMIADIKKKVDRIRNGELTEETPREETPMNVNARWWMYIRDYDQVKTAAALNQRILVLQGERDYQVPMKEFFGWKTGLRKHPQASFTWYPALNHLFFAGEGTPNPTEYFNPNHTDIRVIEDVARWIKNKP